VTGKRFTFVPQDHKRQQGKGADRGDRGGRGRGRGLGGWWVVAGEQERKNNDR
jgi:hypothetical protein